MAKKHFTLIVAGDNPDEIVEKYDNSIEVEPYVELEFSKAPIYHRNCVRYYKELLDSNDQYVNEHREEIQDLFFSYVSMDDTEYYLELVGDRELDEETGNLISTKNKDGKYDKCHIGNKLSIPFILKDGTESFSALKSEIDWSKMHMNNTEKYEKAWDFVVDKKKPETKEDKKIFQNMKDKLKYFLYFGSRDVYVKSSCSFFGFAFADKNGWNEIDEKTSQIDWIVNFYDRFINNLKDDTRLTVYECIRN